MTTESTPLPSGEGQAVVSGEGGVANSGRGRTWTAVALLFLGALCGGGPGVAWLAVVWLVVTALLVLDTLGVSRNWAGLVRRPFLGSVAAIVYVLGAFYAQPMSCGSIFYWVGLFVFLADARRRGELGSYDPRLLWRGGGMRVTMFVSLLLALASFSTVWENEYHTSGWTETHREGHWKITTTHRPMTFGGKEDAYDAGLFGWPTTLLLVAALVLAWRGPRGQVVATSNEYQFYPVGLAAMLVTWGIYHAVKLHRDVVETRTNEITTFDAPGPTWFIIFLIPMGVAAILFAVKGDRWRAKALGVTG